MSAPHQPRIADRIDARAGRAGRCRAAAGDPTLRLRRWRLGLDMPTPPESLRDAPPPACPPLLTRTRTRPSLPTRLRDPGDDRSWREFFNRYWRLIHTTALRAGLTHAEAEEVVQETIIAISRSIAEFDYKPEAGSFRGWLLNTTRWKIQDQFRRRAQCAGKPAQHLREGIRDPGANELEAIWDREWEANLIEQALHRLKSRVPALQYQIFDLYVLKEWPAERVARVLGVQRGYVFVVKHRALRFLRRALAGLDKEMT